MAVVSNKHVGVGVAIAGLALIAYSIHEARGHVEWVRAKLWIAGPTLVVLGITMARHPGSGPIGDDNEPALTPRERRMWIVAGAIGLAVGAGWHELLLRL